MIIETGLNKNGEVYCYSLPVMKETRANFLFHMRQFDRLRELRLKLNKRGMDLKQDALDMKLRIC